MRALTLWRPWALWVALGAKRIENRPWAPPVELLGKRFAIHAGRTFDRDGIALARKVLGDRVYGFRLDDWRHREGIIGTVQLVGWCDADGTIIRHSTGFADRYLLAADRDWLFGPYGWLLRDARLFDVPIAASGRQKLWWLSPEQHRAVLRAKAAP